MYSWIYLKLCEARRYKETTYPAGWLMWLTVVLVLTALAIGKAMS